MNLDYFTRNLVRLSARSVVLISGKPVALRFPTGDKFAQQSLTHEELTQLLLEAAPPASHDEIHAGHAPSPFVYVTEGQRFQIKVEALGGIWRVTIKLAEEEQAGAPVRAPIAGSINLAEVPSLPVTRNVAAAGPPAIAPAPAPVAAPAYPPFSASHASTVAHPTAAYPRPFAPAPPAPAPVLTSAPSPPSPAASAAAPQPVAAPSPSPAPAPVVHVISADSKSPELDKLLHILVADKGSDLHLTANLLPRYRVGGNVIPVPGWPVFSDEQLRAMLVPVMPERVRKEWEETWDGDFAYAIEGLSRFRCNVGVDRHGAYAVIRRIPFEILSPEQIGLPKKVLELCWLTKGLVLVTGPTGSGKSTTLATLIDFINANRQDHIITIEDPVEFVHPDTKRCLIRQREVGEHTTSFKRALKAALREDPNIILVGELRDLETIAIAIETAETGHLVFGTLHTSTAPSTVDRIIDQFPADEQAQIRVMLSESLRGVIAQTLCKKIGGGRVAAYEILIANKAIANLIREGKTFQLYSMMQTNKASGNLTLGDSLMQLVKSKTITPEEAWVKAVNKEELKMMFDKAGITVTMQGAIDD